MTTSSSKLTRAERVRQTSRERREREKAELREAILKAAGELFVEVGFENFSMRQVAERIGYSATTIYLYFEDKDALLFAVVDEGFARFGERLARIASRVDDPWERVLELGKEYIAFGIENPVYYRMMFIQRPDFLLGRRVGEHKPRLNSFGILQSSVQAALDAGILKPGDARTYSDALWSLVHGITAIAITMPVFDKDRIEPIVRTALEMCSDGLRQPRK